MTENTATEPTTAEPNPGKNIVICCDGTSNEFGTDNTNVVRLVQVLEQDSKTQIVFYDPGVGTLPEPGLITKLAKSISKVMGLAFGAGIIRKVVEAYVFLMDSWRPGDRVFLFGFSRGAYTVRILAGMLHQIGLLRPGQVQLVPYAIRLYRAAHRTRYWELCGEFRKTFCQPCSQSNNHQFQVHFVGVWDTVSSVGWAWNPKSFVFTTKNSSVVNVRHAVSLDERRWFFRQNLFHKASDGQDLIERWFPGVHCDIGGGYPDGFLWRVAFDWMLDEAIARDIRINHNALAALKLHSKPTGSIWAEPRHESLKWYWWPAELFPKLAYRGEGRIRLPRVGLGRHRFAGGATLHESVLKRIRADGSYRPPNLPLTTINKILTLVDGETWPEQVVPDEHQVFLQILSYVIASIVLVVGILTVTLALLLVLLLCRQ